MERLLSQGDSDKDTVQKMCHPLCYCDKCEKLVSGWALFTLQMHRKLCGSLYLRFASESLLLLIIEEFGGIWRCSKECVCVVWKNRRNTESIQKPLEPIHSVIEPVFPLVNIVLLLLNQTYISGTNPLLLTKYKILYGIFCQCKRIKGSKTRFLSSLAVFISSILPPAG